MENVRIFYGHLECSTAVLHILGKFAVVAETLFSSFGILYL
jgi:hypothetical protein